MYGTPEVPFSTLFTNTVATHGLVWAKHYYTRNGMRGWEFAFWCRATAIKG